MDQVLYELPEGWEWKALSETTLNAKSDIVDGPFGSNLKASEYVSEGVPILRLQNVDRLSFINKNIQFITKEKADQLSRHSYKVGDIVITKLGAPLGKACIVPDDFEDGRIVADIVRARINEGAFDKRYICYAINSSVCVRQLERQTKGATRPRVNLSHMRELILPVAPIAEQKRIVEKLDALLTRIDTAIEHLQESITLNSSLFQSALDGQFSAITDRMTIESLAEVKGGKRLPKGEKLSDEVTDHPYIRVADFTDKGTIDLSDIKYISKEIHEQIKRYVISKDDLYISIAGTIGKTGFVPPELDGANLTENAAKLVIKDKQQLDLSYLYLFTLTSDFSAQAGLATKTVAQPKLALTRLSKIEIPMCSLEEQKELVETIEALKSKVHNAEEVLLAKIEDLQSLKSSILDAAFKGEL